MSKEAQKIHELPLPAELGTPVRIESLSGMGYGRVYRIETDKTVFALKCSEYPRERLFYEKLARELNRQGIHTPHKLWSYEGEQSWVALEWIPQILPESRWRVDDEVFETLALLHSVKLDLSNIEPEPMQWSAAMNEQMLLRFGLERDLYLRLENLRQDSSFLFEPRFFLSGDPSGRNWGVRENGELVLFDWERFGFGMPQIDLSCVAFGEPSEEVFYRIAEGYLNCSRVESDIAKFAREIQVARIHCCINMLSIHASGRGHLPEAYVAPTLDGIRKLMSRIG